MDTTPDDIVVDDTPDDIDAPALADTDTPASDTEIGGRGAQFIEALRLEREGYLARGLDNRVAEVDEQIRIYGGNQRTTNNSKPRTNRKA